MNKNCNGVYIMGRSSGGVKKEDIEPIVKDVAYEKVDGLTIGSDSDENPVIMLDGTENDGLIIKKDSIQFDTPDGESHVITPEKIDEWSASKSWYGTQAEFDALSEYDETGETQYFISDQLDYKTDIKNLPLIPKKVSELPNDAHYLQGVKKINGISMRGEGDVDIMKIINEKTVYLTQEEFDALEEKDAEKLYIIEGEGGSGSGRKTFYLDIQNITSVEAKMQAAEIAQYAIQNQTTDFDVIGINGPVETLVSSDIATNGINELTIYFLWGNGVETIKLTATSPTDIEISRDGVVIPTETKTLTFTMDDGSEETIDVLIQ